MPESEAKATFAMDLEGDLPEVSAKMAKSLEELRERMTVGQDRLRQYNSALKNLRGTSAEVTAAKEQLKAKLKAERDTMSQAQLAALKLKGGLGQVGQESRKTADSKESMVKAGKHVIESVDLEKLAFGALAVAEGFAIVKLGEWIAKGADFNRSLKIQAEAMSGSEANAEAMGNQIDALANKLSTPKEKLYEMEGALTKALIGSRVSGQAIEDTFEAVARASDAMGDSVGASLADIVKRGKMMGRIAINPFELQGTGLPDFVSIAGKLAKNAKIPLEEAKSQLMYGVSADAGAKALLDASIEKYGRVNEKKFLSLSTIFSKLGERLRGLIPTGWLDKGLAGLDRMFSMLDKGTVIGSGISSVFEGIGRAFADVVTDGEPLWQSFLERMIIGALKMEIAFFRLKKGLKGFTSSPEFKIAIGLLGAIAAATAPVTTAFVAWAAAFDQLNKLIREMKGFDLGAQIKKDLWHLLGVHGPEEWQGGPVEAPAHADGGIVTSAGEGLASVAPGEIILPKGTTQGDVGARGGNLRAELHIHVHGASDSKGHEIVAAMETQGLTASVLKMLEDLARGSGLPTHAEVTA